MNWYKTGTATFTNGSAIVTGASTLWTDVGTLNPGDILYGPDGKLYEILTINSNTGITLASNYLGSTLSGQAYSIMSIGLLPSTLAQAVKSTLATANTALASTVRYDINSMGLSLTQQQNARTNIAALSALDVGAGRLSKSVAGGVDVTLTAVEASAQFIELTGTITANINVIVPAAARLLFVYNGTSGAFTVTVKTPGGTGVTALQSGRVLIECDGTNCVDGLSQMRQTGGTINGTPIGGTTPAAGSFTTLSATLTSTTSPIIALNYNGSSTYANHLMNSGGTYVISTPTANGVTSGSMALQTGVGGSLSIYTNGTATNALPQAILDASGNLGLGVTPSVWTTGKVLEIGNAGNALWGNSVGSVYLTQNAHYNGGWQYATSGHGSAYQYIGDGGMGWAVAPSGTAGASITFTQAMTLTANGSLYVCGATATAPATGFAFIAPGESSVQRMQVGHPTGTASGGQYAEYLYNSAVIGTITQNGTTAVAYNTTSDHRLKTNVRPANAAQFMAIEFVDFEWTDGRHDCGVIADQLQSVYPDLVLGAKDATEVRTVEITPAVAAVLDAEGVEVTPAIPAVTEQQTFPVYQQVNYMGLIGRMGTVIQQQSKLIAAMEVRLAALEAK